MAQLTNIDSQVNSFFAITSFDSFIPNLIQVIIAVGALATLVYLFWGAFQFITAGGDQEDVKGAKQKITQALFGLAILASIWVIWRLVVYFLGISSSASGTFHINIPTP